MTTNYSICVRELISFSYFEPDIVSDSQMLKKMQDGTLAHTARQVLSDENFKSEVSISSNFEYKARIFKISGRIDLFCDDDNCTSIEEIKHSTLNKAEITAQNQHMQQLYVYSAMLFNNNESLNNISLKLAYVNVEGKIICEFNEAIDRPTSLKKLFALLAPYAEFCIKESNYILDRNKSIDCFEFPFASFRAGQHEFASQVFTAIRLQKKLFACLPTGTGKSIATIYPAIKALNLGLTQRILYLTARTTARQSPLNSLELLIDRGMKLRVLTISAKEKLCLHDMICSPLHCPYAKGHYIRQKEAITQIQSHKIWHDEIIIELSKEHMICPFEFALSLSLLADVILMDINYVFNPFAMIQRLSANPKENTLLVDEAHHLIDRLRDGLSGNIDLNNLLEYRKAISKVLGRKGNLYKSLTLFINILKDIDVADGQMLIDDLPSDVFIAVDQLKYYVSEFLGNVDLLKQNLVSKELIEIFKTCSNFSYAYQHRANNYKIIANKSKSNLEITLFCLDPAFRIKECTYNTNGAIFFSATLNPLNKMKIIFGANDSDACFSLPSPFPKENLLVLLKKTNTYYSNRQNSIDEIVSSICSIVDIKHGKYIVYMPSYEYLLMLEDKLKELSPIDVLVQCKDMSNDEKESFLNSFIVQTKPVLGLCVLGGSFSEGIDLPGDMLIGVFVVGVGLAVPSFKTELIKDFYEEKYGNGYEFAYQYPAIQKILQACGRLIRSETDRGILMFFDKRYAFKNYMELLPSQWQLHTNNHKVLCLEFFKAKRL